MKTSLSLLLLPTIAMSTNPFPAPSFCHDLDCPSFTTKTTSDSLEVRSYDTLLWASTSVQSSSATDAGDIAFGRLFGYLSGANEAGQKIDMTAPVLNYIQPGEGPNCNTTFTVSFFVPWEFQTKSGPPPPTASDVSISLKEIGSVAVSSFGGFAKDEDMVSHASDLSADILDSKDLDFAPEAEAGSYFFVAYDSPYTLMNRHNEDWIGVVDAKDAE
ncbi:hypothetical protein TrRE_jg1808 [Triparma retinervis]|uniref:Heme-binding protein 2 n=1 Tax=Triparma retinervis TaxID=2557542 RepID=A0A9W7L211_9STRA|nr:hypothetical protein TrRE_jg1808 [Triparma retinervis]